MEGQVHRSRVVGQSLTYRHVRPCVTDQVVEVSPKDVVETELVTGLPLSFRPTLTASGPSVKLDPPTSCRGEVRRESKGSRFVPVDVVYRDFDVFHLWGGPL